jgi:hypothetical protein
MQAIMCQRKTLELQPQQLKTKGSTKIEADMPSKGSPEVVQIRPLLPRQNINATMLNRYGIISCISQTNRLQKCLMI